MYINCLYQLGGPIMSHIITLTHNESESFRLYQEITNYNFSGFFFSRYPENKCNMDLNSEGLLRFGSDLVASGFILN